MFSLHTSPHRPIQWCLAAVVLFVACPRWSASETVEPEAESFKFEHPAMGTLFEITMYPPKPDMGREALQEIADQAWAAIDALEQRISNWIPESELSELNRRGNLQPVKVGSDIFALLEASRKVHAETDGAFDPTVGPLIDLWGFYKKVGHFPGDVELEDALSRVGLDMVEQNPQDGTVRLKKSRMRLDFGGIGKGYAVDVAVSILREAGVSAALVHGGTSTAYGIGHPPGKTGWKVRMEQSYNTQRDYIEEVEIADASFSTSSGVEKFFVLEGKTYCHIFDPKTGIPVEGVLTAMSIAPSGTESDALSTAFFVMGEERVQAYCGKHPEYRAILMVPGGEGAVETRRYNFK